MTRTWHIDQSAVEAYCRQGAESRVLQLLAGREIRYREVPAARRGPDGYDGWHELSDAERDCWANRARDQFSTTPLPPGLGATSES